MRLRAPEWLLPRTLHGRVLLVLLAGLVLAHIASYLAASLERSWNFQRLQAQSFAEGVAQMMRSPDAPRAEPGPRREGEPGPRRDGEPGRPEPGRGPGPGFGGGHRGPDRMGNGPNPRRMAFGPQVTWRLVAADEGASAEDRPVPGHIERTVRATLVEQTGADPLVRLALREGGGAPAPLRKGGGFKGDRGGGPDNLVPAPEMHRLIALVKLADGRLAVAEGGVFGTSFRFPAESWITISVLFVLTALVSWWAVRLAVRPVRTLAAAAERLSTNIEEPALAEEGPREIRDAARAFNRMQDRLARHVNTRALAFAALSHDMRTPLTRMHLRLESIDDPGQLDKLRADLDEIEGLVRAALDVTRGLSHDEPIAPTALLAMARGIAADFTALGGEVAVDGTEVEVAARPRSLRRAISNLVDNALHYGGEVALHVGADAARATVTVADRGPGIPEEELARVTQPYYRVEGSRSRETGGAGLGLAIAKDIVEAHGGQLALANREGGGLEARITLPR